VISLRRPAKDCGCSAGGLTMNHKTPVVVLGSGHHGALGIVRSLGRLGVPVYCVDSGFWEPAFSSRYCRGRFLLNIEGDRSVNGLLKIGRKLGGPPILIPTTDRGAVWMADHEPLLREAFSFPLQGSGLARLLSDKGRMQDLANRNGVPTAQSL